MAFDSMDRNESGIPIKLIILIGLTLENSRSKVKGQTSEAFQVIKVWNSEIPYQLSSLTIFLKNHSRYWETIFTRTYQFIYSLCRWCHTRDCTGETIYRRKQYTWKLEEMQVRVKQDMVINDVQFEEVRM